MLRTSNTFHVSTQIFRCFNVVKICDIKYDISVASFFFLAIQLLKTKFHIRQGLLFHMTISDHPSLRY
jgi:hypothetical protein